eukprot:UN3080
MSMNVLEGPRGEMIERKGYMTTIFLHGDGTPCKVGGKSEWSNEDSLNGISGTLREFLACAGLDLDSSPRTLLAASGLAPHVRTMGLSLELQLDYQNSIWVDGVTCYVRVSAVPLWIFKQTTDPKSAGAGAVRHRGPAGRRPLHKELQPVDVKARCHLEDLAVRGFVARLSS